jgi:SWI/SNF-related matrix-associated actin-dependent regulator 1 of chromatin subfamily A
MLAWLYKLLGKSTLKLHYDNTEEEFFCTHRYDESNKLRDAGFFYNIFKERWWTDNVEIAHRLIEYADDETRSVLLKQLGIYESDLEASRAVSSDLVIPSPPGLEYLPYQKAGIAFTMRRNNVLIGDEMGLGKTIQALGAINADDSVRKVLVICPATLKINWTREAEKWLVREFSIGIASGAKGHKKVWPDTDFVVINFEIVKYHLEDIRSTEWDMLIIDEAHYLRNPKAQRTQKILGFRDPATLKFRVHPIKARRKIYLTGTPIVNRPKELWPLVHSLDPNTFDSAWVFTRRYCEDKSKLEELQKKLRTSVMVRRLKEDVLKELPPKVRQVIEIPSIPSAINAEHRVLDRCNSILEELRSAVAAAEICDEPGEYEEAVRALSEAKKVAFEEISRVRRDTALVKAPLVAKYAKEIFEDSEEKIIIFAHHNDVIDILMEEFGDEAVRIDGRVALKKRQEAVDRFQNDPSVKYFVYSISTAVGTTLTASSRVLFAELDWVPGNISQAEDRSHRFGQENTVFVQHLVLEGSIDARMAEVLIEKQELIGLSLDRKSSIDFREVLDSL